MTARSGRDPGERYQELCGELGDPVYERIDAAVTPAQKVALSRLTAEDLALGELGASGSRR